MLLVTVMELCPRVREISNMGTPWLLATEAKLCRRPWREILGSPCRRTTVSRSRVSWSGLGGAPSCRSTTHSFGSSLRRLSRRSTCCRSWSPVMPSRRAEVRVLGDFSTTLPPTSVRTSRMESSPASRSTFSHRRPQISLRRRPR